MNWESSAKEGMITKAQPQREVNKEEHPREQGLKDGQRSYFQRAEPRAVRGLTEELLHRMTANDHNPYLQERGNCCGLVIIVCFSFFFFLNGRHPVPTPNYIWQKEVSQGDLRLLVHKELHAHITEECTPSREPGLWVDDS